MSKRLRKRHIGNHLPAYPHDEKVVLSKNTTKVTFLWRYASDEVLIQIDNIRQPGVRGGTKTRTTKTSTKEFARKIWTEFVVHNGYAKTQ